MVWVRVGACVIFKVVIFFSSASVAMGLDTMGAFKVQFQTHIHTGGWITLSYTHTLWPWINAAFEPLPQCEHLITQVCLCCCKRCCALCVSLSLILITISAIWKRVKWAAGLPQVVHITNLSNIGRAWFLLFLVYWFKKIAKNKRDCN